MFLFTKEFKLYNFEFAETSNQKIEYMNRY